MHVESDNKLSIDNPYARSYSRAEFIFDRVFPVMSTAVSNFNCQVEFYQGLGARKVA